MKYTLIVIYNEGLFSILQKNENKSKYKKKIISLFPSILSEMLVM